GKFGVAYVKGCMQSEVLFLESPWRPATDRFLLDNESAAPVSLSLISCPVVAKKKGTTVKQTRQKGLLILIHAKIETLDPKSCAQMVADGRWQQGMVASEMGKTRW
ncbi:hypothetical protein Tco_1049476, partial [Tanacetum coccineum]